MADFATHDDVAARWRPLSLAEQDRASVLIGDASRMIRRRFPKTDARITSGELDAAELIAIVAQMVKRVLMAGDREGVIQASETTGPFAHSERYANPQGNLYLSKDDIAVLTPAATARAFSIDLTPGR